MALLSDPGPPTWTQALMSPERGGRPSLSTFLGLSHSFTHNNIRLHIPSVPWRQLRPKAFITDWLVVTEELAFIPDEQQVLLDLAFVLLQYWGAQGPA